MRKNLLLFLIGVIGLGIFSGCTKTEVVERAIMPNRTFIYTVTPNAWQEDASNPLHIYTVLDLPELERYYLEQGYVSVAISGDGESSYDILPSTFGGIAYSVRYQVGQVIIYGEDPISDGSFEVPFPTGNVVFKVVLSDSDFVP